MSSEYESSTGKKFLSRIEHPSAHDQLAQLAPPSHPYSLPLSIPLSFFSNTSPLEDDQGGG